MWPTCSIRVFVQDCYAGADPDYRIKVRVVTEQAWHSLFAQNMFITPTEEEHSDFEPDFTVLHAPNLQSIPAIDGTGSEVFVMLNFAEKLILVGGSHYTGEIKKTIFSVLNYLLPAQNVLPMRCSPISAKRAIRQSFSACRARARRPCRRILPEPLMELTNTAGRITACSTSRRLLRQGDQPVAGSGTRNLLRIVAVRHRARKRHAGPAHEVPEFR